MESGSYRSLLATSNYRSLLIAQFSGALNDNLYRLVASLFVVNLAATGMGSVYVTLAGALFILPYLTLSGAAGRLADARGRRHMLVAAKSAELVVMILAMAALYLHSIELVLGVLFLMATQSTFFSPARYGILSDIVARKDLSRANGFGEMCVFAAILLGCGLGGAIFELWREQVYLAALPMIAIAVVGLIASCYIIAPVPTARSEAQPRGGNIVRGLRLLRANPALARVVMLVSYFWGLGAMIQFDILFYARDVIGLGETAIGLLQATIGLGIGSGCLVAGWLSGNRVRLSLAKAGMAGIAVSFVMLGLLPPGLLVAFSAVGAAGFAGGLFIVPLLSYMHERSPEHSRSLLFATNNFLNMFGVMVGIGLAYGLHDLCDLGPARLFLAIGLIALAPAVAGLSSRRDHRSSAPVLSTNEKPWSDANPMGPASWTTERTHGGSQC